MQHKTMAQLAQALTNKEFSARELTEYYLQRIKQHGPALNCFVTVTAEQALQQAEQADARRAAGESSPLLGIPLAHQDLFCTQDVRTSCGSKMLDNFIAPYNAQLIEQLNQAGAVSLGKLNMDEFAMGSSGQTSFYGACNNPWDNSRVVGGAASGSAAAVAAGLAAASTAMDSGGDIRLPAAFNGLTGLKPSYGRVSRWGMTAYASSFDQAGFLTRTAEDSALLLNVCAGFDERDSTSAQETVPDYNSTLTQPLTGLRIGIPRAFFAGDLNSQIGDAVLASAEQLKQLGATLIDIELLHAEQAVAIATIIGTAEASTNMSRFDGVRFGYRCENPRDLADLYQRSRSEGLGEQVQRRILLGTYYLSVEQYQDYYVQAQRIRRLIKQDYMDAFKQVDLILSPTSADLPRAISATVDANADFLAQRYTVAANLAGLPALSLPVGLLEQLPVGAQLIAPHFHEARLLNAAHQYQQATDWHTRTPAGF